MQVMNGNVTNGWLFAKRANSNEILVFVRSGGNPQVTFTTPAISVNEWVHLMLVSPSNTSRTLYINGGTPTTGTANVTPTATSLSVFISRSDAPILGYAAECAVWNEALTVSQVESLARGMSPSIVQPDNLAYYAPLIRSINDIVGGQTITTLGSPTVVDHPRIYGI